MWQKQKRPYLILEQTHIRLFWALDHEDWTEEDWMKVLWSNECSVKKSTEQMTE